MQKKSKGRILSITRICGYCGNPFEAHNSTTRFCSRKCYNRDYYLHHAQIMNLKRAELYKKNLQTSKSGKTESSTCFWRNHYSSGPHFHQRSGETYVCMQTNGVQLNPCESNQGNSLHLTFILCKME